jgi:hypothetical protein
MKRRDRVTAIALGLGWLAALTGLVVVANATRSAFAGTNSGAAPTIVALTAPAILLAAWRLHDPLIAWLTIVAAATVSCVLAWNVLHDEHSTAAIGIPYPAVCAGFVVLVGIAIQDRLRRDP